MTRTPSGSPVARTARGQHVEGAGTTVGGRGAAHSDHDLGGARRDGRGDQFAGSLGSGVQRIVARRSTGQQQARRRRHLDHGALPIQPPAGVDGRSERTGHPGGAVGPPKTSSVPSPPSASGRSRVDHPRSVGRLPDGGSDLRCGRRSAELVRRGNDGSGHGVRRSAAVGSAQGELAATKAVACPAFGRGQRLGDRPTPPRVGRRTPWPGPPIPSDGRRGRGPRPVPGSRAPGTSRRSVTPRRGRGGRPADSRANAAISVDSSSDRTHRRWAFSVGVHPVGPRKVADARGRHDRRVGALQRRGELAAGLRLLLQPPGEVVVNGDVKDLVDHQVADARTEGRATHDRQHARRLGGQRPFQRGAEVAGQVAGVHLHLHAQQDRAVLPGQGGGRAGKDASERDARASRRWRQAGGSGAVAEGTNSRSATSSVSAASPANGRLTIRSAASADPWHALYRRPEPHGQGWRGLMLAVVAEVSPRRSDGRSACLLRHGCHGSRPRRADRFARFPVARRDPSAMPWSWARARIAAVAVHHPQRAQHRRRRSDSRGIHAGPSM